MGGSHALTRLFSALPADPGNNHGGGDAWGGVAVQLLNLVRMKSRDGERTNVSVGMDAKVEVGKRAGGAHGHAGSCFRTR